MIAQDLSGLTICYVRVGSRTGPWDGNEKTLYTCTCLCCGKQIEMTQRQLCKLNRTPRTSCRSCYDAGRGAKPQPRKKPAIREGVARGTGYLSPDQLADSLPARRAEARRLEQARVAQRRAETQARLNRIAAGLRPSAGMGAA